SPTPGTANSAAVTPGLVRVNEWMAVNSATIPDPSDARFDDWFELFNPNGFPVELTGLRLTDNPAVPDKFTIPAGTAVAARQFLIVWADEDSGRNAPGSDLHVNFRLSGGGETIRVSAPDGTVVDSVAFGTQTPDVSEGRWPDGSTTVLPMYFPTPCGSNVVFAVRGVSEVSGDSATVSWPSKPGVLYRVESSDDLTSPTNWTPIGIVTAQSAVSWFEDPALTGAGHRFYRISELDP
ncbi:lamin tail domain-containing protein, partial [Verrucomicrobiota bacterium]